MSILFVLIVFGITAGTGVLAVGIMIGIYLGRKTRTRLSHKHPIAPSQRDSLPATEITSAELPKSNSADSLDGQSAAEEIELLRSHQNDLQDRLCDAELRMKRQAEQINDYLTEARTDELTGLPNRRAIERLCALEIEKGVSSSRPLVITIVDVDHFKRINDRFGHSAGDETLRAIARAFKDHLNSDSTAARFGGEEFLIVSRSSLEDTVKDLEQMRVRLSRHPLQIGADKTPISISAGICEILPETSFELAMRRADQALYEAKRGGRNSVWWHDGSRVIRR
ncbi:MAG: GGDEF domain-containing protein [Planctomycetota bacterium]|nr:GGDEF domain-containing protein [Planctomycetota bacterium]